MTSIHPCLAGNLSKLAHSTLPHWLGVAPPVLSQKCRRLVWPIHLARVSIVLRIVAWNTPPSTFVSPVLVTFDNHIDRDDNDGRDDCEKQVEEWCEQTVDKPVKEAVRWQRLECGQCWFGTWLVVRRHAVYCRE